MNYSSKSDYGSFSDYINNSAQYSLEKSQQSPSVPSHPNYLNFYNNFNYNPNYHHHHYYYMNDLEYQQNIHEDSSNGKNENWKRKCVDDSINHVGSLNTALQYDFEVPQQKTFEQLRFSKISDEQFDKFEKQDEFSFNGYYGESHSEIATNKNEELTLDDGQWCNNDVESKNILKLNCSGSTEFQKKTDKVKSKISKGKKFIHRLNLGWTQIYLIINLICL